jgi:hypothetical protein
MQLGQWPILISILGDDQRRYRYDKFVIHPGADLIVAPGRRPDADFDPIRMGHQKHGHQLTAKWRVPLERGQAALWGQPAGRRTRRLDHELRFNRLKPPERVIHGDERGCG